ncbi:MAG: hypothetical protein ACRD4O_12680 [Bryobacteraceae bacterium]
MDSDSLVTRPKGLSQLELASLAVWFCAIGRWEHAGLTEAEAQSFVMHFFECLKDNKRNALRANCLSLQNAFMTMRKDTFEAIQSEPPFSRFGRKNMTALLRAWLDGQKPEFMNTWREIFYPEWNESVPVEQVVRVIDNSGESAQNAIHIVTDEKEDKVNGEYWYLYHRYGKSWRCDMQMSTVPDANGRRFDLLHVRFRDGQNRKFYFLL